GNTPILPVRPPALTRLPRKRHSPKSIGPDVVSTRRHPRGRAPLCACGLRSPQTTGTPTAARLHRKGLGTFSFTSKFMLGSCRTENKLAIVMDLQIFLS